MAGLEGGVLFLVDVFPTRSTGQQPEDAFEDLDGIGAFAPGGFLLLLRQDGPQAIPLLQGQVHASIIQQLPSTAVYKRGSNCSVPVV
jgi:hypothetical protein